MTFIPVKYCVPDYHKGTTGGWNHPRPLQYKRQFDVKQATEDALIFIFTNLKLPFLAFFLNLT